MRFTHPLYLRIGCEVADRVRPLPRDVQTECGDRHCVGLLCEADADAVDVDDRPRDTAENGQQQDHGFLLVVGFLESADEIGHRITQRFRTGCLGLREMAQDEALDACADGKARPPITHVRSQ